MIMSTIKYSALIIFLSFYLKAYSQTDKEKFMLGGQYYLNFTSYTSTFKGSNNSYEIGKYSTFDISPQIGFFILKNVPVGLEFLYSYGKTIEGSSVLHSSSYSFIPFVRYYFGKSKINPYLNVGAGPGWQTISTDSGSGPSNVKIFTYQFMGGLRAFIFDCVSLDLSLGYKSTTENYTDHFSSGIQTSKIVNKGFHTVIGFVVYL
jgi:outer membrane protein